MASQWTPPPDGTPCWINIFATDVPRARAFYSSALGWTFRESTRRMDGTEEDPSQIAHFDLGSTCPAGGITKVGEVKKTDGKGGNVMYLYVNNLAGTEKVNLPVRCFDLSGYGPQQTYLVLTCGRVAENYRSWRQEDDRCYSRRQHCDDATLRGH